MRKKIKCSGREDFDARKLARLVQTANGFDSRIYLEYGDSRINAKSIMGMMSIGKLGDVCVVIDAEGTDEAEALAGFVKENNRINPYVNHR